MTGRKRTGGNSNKGACDTGAQARNQPREQQRDGSDGNPDGKNPDGKAQRFQQEGREQVRQTKEDIEHASHDAKQKAREMTESAKHQFSEATHEAGREMREQAQRAKAEGREFLNRQKDWAADETAHFGSAIREAADKLHAEGDDAVAGYADMAAHKIEEVAGYLRRRDAGGLLDDVECMARRRPEIVFGGLFVVGLGIARFLKASGARRRREEREEQARNFRLYASTSTSPSVSAAGLPSQHVDRPYAANPTTAPGYVAEPHASAPATACPTMQPTATTAQAHTH